MLFLTLNASEMNFQVIKSLIAIAYLDQVLKKQGIKL